MRARASPATLLTGAIVLLVIAFLLVATSGAIWLGSSLWGALDGDALPEGNGHFDVVVAMGLVAAALPFFLFGIRVLFLAEMAGLKKRRTHP